MPAPIAVFAFNRPDHLRKTLDALAANDLAHESELTIFCDGPRNPQEREATEAVRAVAREERAFRSTSIVAHDANIGCAGALIHGLSEMFDANENVIVIEDDVLCSPHTLRFLNTGLAKYRGEPTVFNISAWSPPPTLAKISSDYPFDAYFVPRFNCWGWAAWRDRWNKVDWDMPDYEFFSTMPVLRQAFNCGGEELTQMLSAQMEGRIDAWDIRMDYARFKHGCVGLNPVYSYTTNIGMGSGTHTTEYTDRLDNDLSLVLADPRLPDHIFLDEDVVAAYRKAYSYTPPALPIRIANKIWRTITGKNYFPV